MENIKGFGYMNIIPDISKSEGTLKAQRFFKKFTREFVKQSAKYIEFAHEATFTYRERQLHTTIAPVLDKITDAFLFESPVDRNWSKLQKYDYEDSHGWVDYWCRTKNIDFFIEIKHDYCAYRTGKIRDSTIRHWKQATNQLTTIRNEARKMSKYSKGSFLLLLHILPIYETKSIKKEFDSIVNNDKLLLLQKHYHYNLKPKPNWSSLVVFNNKLVNNFVNEYKEDGRELKQCFPALLFIVRMSNLYKVR